jgi:hypothetical protein
MGEGIGRRAVLAGMGSLAAGPLTAALAQDSSKLRNLAVVIGLADDAEMQRRTSAFEDALERHGWSKGGNIRITYRYADSDIGRMRNYA